MTMTTKTLALLFFLGTSLLLGSQANANLVLNGSFELNDSRYAVPTGWSYLKQQVVKSDVDPPVLKRRTTGTLDMVRCSGRNNAFQLQDTGGATRSSGLTSDAFTVTHPR